MAKEENSPLVGVSIAVKNTTNGTTTDAAGRFSLEVPQGATLVFSSVGYRTQQIEAVQPETDLRIVLEEDITQLSTVVVTGQGIGLSRNRISTVVDVITADELPHIPYTRLDQILQGNLPGAQVNFTSGSPGTTAIVRSRGIGSAVRSTTPIIYIDGIRVDNLSTESALGLFTGGEQSSALADIPLEDIERIEFVKGGAATTLYGSDAANGVIQVFTKRGTPGRGIFTLESAFGRVSGTDDYFKFSQTGALGFRPGFMQLYRFGASGGTDQVTYSLSANAYNDDGFLIEDGLTQKRYNLRASMRANLHEKVSYSLSTAYSSNNFTRQQNGDSFFSRIYGVEQGQQGDPREWDAATRAEVDQFLHDVTRLYNFREQVRRFQTSHALNYYPFSDVAVNFSIGMDYRFSRQKAIETNAFLIAQGSVSPGTSDQGTIDISDRNFLTTTGNLNIQWDKSIGEFSLITTAGGQFFRDDDKQSYIGASNVTEGSQSVNNAATTTAEDFLIQVVNYGFFIAENIGFRDRYFLDAGLRVDYNTAFGSEVGGQVFPRIGFSYLLSDEPFMAGTSTYLSSVRLRASYGEAGNFPPPFTRDKLIIVTGFDGEPSFQPGQPGAPDLKPERLKTFEFGADLALFNNRVSLGITYFDSKTVDALFTAPFAPSQGDENQIRNLGEISNKGLELTAGISVLATPTWNLDLSGSLNTIENKVVSMGGAAEFRLGGFPFLGNYVSEGLPVGYFRGSKPVFAADGSLASSTPNAFLGKPLPDLYGNFGLNLSYKGTYSLSLTGSYQQGADIADPNEVLRYLNGIGNDRIPEASQSVNFMQMAGAWVEPGNYVKVRNIAFSYRFPESFLPSGLRDAMVSLSVVNPINITSSVAVDPEITGAGAPAVLPGTSTWTQQALAVGGFFYGTFSPPRQYVVALKLKF